MTPKGFFSVPANPYYRMMVIEWEASLGPSPRLPQSRVERQLLPGCLANAGADMMRRQLTRKRRNASFLNSGVGRTSTLPPRP